MPSVMSLLLIGVGEISVRRLKLFCIIQLIALEMKTKSYWRVAIVIFSLLRLSLKYDVKVDTLF